MSLHKSLKHKGALVRRRNVLSRAERIERLEKEGHWEDEGSIFGLPKVKVRVSSASRARKKKKKEEAEAAAAEAAEAPEAEPTEQ